MRMVVALGLAHRSASRVVLGSQPEIALIGLAHADGAGGGAAGVSGTGVVSSSVATEDARSTKDAL
jgi:hypothetical protein